MTCDGCASKIESALRRESGVQAVRVLLDQKKAIVYGDADAERLRRAVRDAGFTPSQS